MNKVRFGLSNVVAFPITENTKGAITYGEKIAIPGAVSIKISPIGDSESFYADNKAYYTTDSGAGYEAEVEIALIPDKFDTECLGAAKDQQGAIIETATPAPKKNFALAFQFEGDESATKHILYCCTASKSDLEGKTKEDKVDVATETIKLTAASDADGNIKAKVMKGNTGYDTFFDSPYKIKQVEGL